MAGRRGASRLEIAPEMTHSGGKPLLVLTNLAGLPRHLHLEHGVRSEIKSSEGRRICVELITENNDEVSGRPQDQILARRQRDDPCSDCGKLFLISAIRPLKA